MRQRLVRPAGRRPSSPENRPGALNKGNLADRKLWYKAAAQRGRGTTPPEGADRGNKRRKRQEIYASIRPAASRLGERLGGEAEAAGFTSKRGRVQLADGMSSVAQCC